MDKAISLGFSQLGFRKFSGYEIRHCVEVGIEKVGLMGNYLDWLGNKERHIAKNES